MEPLRNYRVYFWIWARRNPLFWLHMLLAGATLLVLSHRWGLPPDKDVHIRLLGTALQAVGIATVAWDIVKTRRDYGDIGFFRSTWMWLRDFPNGPVHVIQAEPARSVAKSFSARIKQGPNPAHSEMEQVRFEIKQLDRAIDVLSKQIADNQDEAENALAVTKADLKAEIRRLRGKVRESATSNGAVLAFGATWLGFGVIFGTVAPEVLGIVNWLRV